MEVVVPVPDFHFDSACTTPYVSAPSSPKAADDHPFDFFRHYTSAPTSPARAAALYALFDKTAAVDAGVPSDWEEKPGTPKTRGDGSPAKEDRDEDAFDFAFEFSGQLDKAGLPALTAADELFEKGKIRPLELPPRLLFPSTSERSSKAYSSESLTKPRELCSPCHQSKGDEFDTFAAAMEEATRADRGREKAPMPPSLTSSRDRMGSRSLSPLRSGSPAIAAPAKNDGEGVSRKWRLKDLLLFRSASEGSFPGNRSKDPLCKDNLAFPSASSSGKEVDARDLKKSSSRSRNSVSASVRSCGEHVAFSHEMHYAANRATSEELKKKTALPYRQSLFGCLRMDTVNHSIWKGFNGQPLGRR